MDWKVVNKETREVFSKHRSEAAAQRSAYKNRKVAPFVIQFKDSEPFLPDWVVNKVMRSEKMQKIISDYIQGTYKIWGE